MHERQIYLQQCESTLNALGWGKDHPRVLGWFAKHNPVINWESASEAHLEKLSQNLQAVLQQQRQAKTAVPGEIPQADLSDAIARCQIQAKRLGWDLRHPLVLDWCKSHGPGSFEAIRTPECFAQLESWLRERQAEQQLVVRVTALEGRVGRLAELCECLADGLLYGIRDDHRTAIKAFAQEQQTWKTQSQ